MHSKLSIKPTKMDARVLNHYLSMRDLTNPSQGIHAINLIINKLQDSLQSKNSPPARIRTSGRISTISDEFDHLHIPLNDAQRSLRYIRYIDDVRLLRSHTTPLIVPALKEVKLNNWKDSLFFFPGICYVKSTITKQKAAEPHKMDIWKIKKQKTQSKNNLIEELIESVVNSIGKKTEYQVKPATHPYTKNGFLVEIKSYAGDWIRLFQGGEIAPILLEDAGLDAEDYSCIGIGLGLDRCAMYIKKIDDIRILRSKNPAIQKQMTDLDAYRPVELQKSFVHDFSIVAMSHFSQEDVCDLIRQAMNEHQDEIEEVKFSDSFYEGNVKGINFRVAFSSFDRILDQKNINKFVSDIEAHFKNPHEENCL